MENGMVYWKLELRNEHTLWKQSCSWWAVWMWLNSDGYSILLELTGDVWGKLEAFEDLLDLLLAVQSTVSLDIYIYPLACVLFSSDSLSCTFLLSLD